MGHRFIEHTADLGIEVQAESLDALFADALVAFTDTVVEVEKVGEAETRRFEIKASDLDELMVTWLEELLYCYETQGLLFRRAEVTLVDEDKGLLNLTATAHGAPHDPRRQPLKTLVKAITYHRLEVEQEDDGSWRAQVIFDL